MKDRIYLDYNASAPLLPIAADAMIKIMHEPHNASSIHGFGREGRSQIETARRHIAALIGTDSEQIIFNSGATEGNNTVIKHFRTQYPKEQIIAGTSEHSAVLEADADLVLSPVDENGRIDLNALEAHLTNGTKTSLVSIMLVNNETGVIQPIKDIADLVHKHGAFLHCDAVQAAGRISVNMQETGIDFMTLSSHKIGGPQGVGALALRLCGETPCLIQGGGQEKSARAGTENVMGITGFGAAAQYALKHLESYQKLQQFQQKLETKLKAISPSCIIHGQNTARVANTTMFSLPGISSETLMMSLDLEGIALSNGSACSSGTVKPSHVLKAMGKNDDEATSALRLSTGWNTAQSDIDSFLTAWEKIYHRLKDKIST